MKLNAILTKFTLPDKLLFPYPCLIILYFFLSTSLPLSMMEFDFISKSSALIYALSMSIVGLIIFPAKSRKWFYWVFIGGIITIIHIQTPLSTYETILPERDVYVEIQGVVVDDNLFFEDSLNWLGERRNIEIKLNKIRLSNLDRWYPCKGKILMRNYEYNLLYGQIIHAKGRLLSPRINSIPGMFDYRNYLKIKRIKHILYTNECFVTGTDSTLWRRLNSFMIRIREQVLLRITDNVDDSGKAILAAMTLGVKPRFSTEDRDKFLRSGMIHLFAISGLHIGILFSIIMTFLSLSGVPFTYRYLLAPILLLVYVTVTGGAPSAVRAWLMLSVWSVGKSMKLPSVTLNSILFAALLLLVYNPFYIFHSGFQFSFVVVICLVEGWRKGRSIVNYLNEKRYWSPQLLQHPVLSQYAIRNFVFKSVLSVISAWLGALGLTAFYAWLLFSENEPATSAGKYVSGESESS